MMKEAKALFCVLFGVIMFLIGYLNAPSFSIGLSEMQVTSRFQAVVGVITFVGAMLAVVYTQNQFNWRQRQDHEQDSLRQAQDLKREKTEAAIMIIADTLVCYKSLYQLVKDENELRPMEAGRYVIKYAQDRLDSGIDAKDQLQLQMLVNLYFPSQKGAAGVFLKARGELYKKAVLAAEYDDSGVESDSDALLCMPEDFLKALGSGIDAVERLEKAITDDFRGYTSAS